MQKNGESVRSAQSLSPDEANVNQYTLIKEENSKLLAENEELKKILQKEKFYHQNLYNQWNELNISVIEKDRKLKHLKLTHNPTLKVYKYAFYSLLFFTALLVVLNFNSSRIRENYISGTSQNSLPVTNVNSRKNAGVTLKKQSPEVNPLNAAQDKNTAGISEALNNSPAPVKADSMIPAVKITGRYLIKQKSYFHNKPATNTQRNTFVLPANDAFGILTSIDEQNGFIYVVFKNRKGRVSKGWLKKEDLEPVQ